MQLVIVIWIRLWMYKLKFLLVVRITFGGMGVTKTLTLKMRCQAVVPDSIRSSRYQEIYAASR